MSGETRSEIGSFYSEKTLVQFARLGLFFLVFVLALSSHLSQKTFMDWGLLKAFYSFVLSGLILHGLEVLYPHPIFEARPWMIFSYVLDVLLVGGLMAQTKLQESLFLFMFMAVVLLAAISLGQRLGFFMAAMTSMSYSLVSLISVDIQSTHLFFLLVINNIGFFSMAWIGGRLGDDLNLMGKELHAKDLSLGSLRQIQELIINTIPTGLLTTKVSGEVLTANPGSEKVFSKGSLSGQNLFTMLPELSHFAAGTVKELRRPIDDSTQLLRVTGWRQYNENLGEEIRLWLIEDLSEIRRMEAALRQSEKMAAIGQLASGIAHEIRNPLAGISGSIELLGPGISAEDDKKLRSNILKEIARLNHLISEFLDFAKPEKEPTDSVDVAKVLNEVLELIRLQNSGVEIRADISPNLLIHGEFDKLKQAFLNITVNAVQAMQDRPTRKLFVTARAKNSNVEVSVLDTGAGIPENIKSRIFEPFLTTKPKGTGLGLAITHKIFQTHRATVSVESKVNEGTEFRIVLPARRI